MRTRSAATTLYHRAGGRAEEALQPNVPNFQGFAASRDSHPLERARRRSPALGLRLPQAVPLPGGRPLGLHPVGRGEERADLHQAGAVGLHPRGPLPGRAHLPVHQAAGRHPAASVAGDRAQAGGGLRRGLVLPARDRRPPADRLRLHRPGVPRAAGGHGGGGGREGAAPQHPGQGGGRRGPHVLPGLLPGGLPAPAVPLRAGHARRVPQDAHRADGPAPRGDQPRAAERGLQGQRDGAVPPAVPRPEPGGPAGGDVRARHAHPQVPQRGRGDEEADLRHRGQSSIRDVFCAQLYAWRPAPG
mmetsp:Transcript_24043/g.37990  ORF Transcript_24043/g.37990 Transcript_24043/m.37990 type:complete len:302 (+) Transcript_24043:247-1152(+)